MGTCVINKTRVIGETKRHRAISGREVYCIGGKAKMQVMFKTIEKYVFNENRWMEIKTQLNYTRQFCSCVCFEDKFIYIFGGSKDTEQIEVLNLVSESEAIKCDLISLYPKSSMVKQPNVHACLQETFCRLFGNQTQKQSEEDFIPGFKQLLLPAFYFFEHQSL